MSLYKRIAFFGLFCLLLSVLNLNLAFAQEITTDTKTKYVETTVATDISDKDQKIVGTIQPGIQIGVQAQSNPDGNVYFQWDGDLASIKEADVKFLTSSENSSFTPVEAATSGTGDKILTHQTTVVYSDTSMTQSILTLAQEVEYSITNTDGDFYTITVGNRTGIVKASDVELKKGISVSTPTSTTGEGSTSTQAALTTSENPADSTVSTQNSSISTSATDSGTTAKFLPTDQFFQVTVANVAVYDNSSGSLVQVGSLTKGQIYPRVSDYGDWHRIKFGNGYGYVWEGSSVPASGGSIKNLNLGLPNTNRYFIPKESLTVYDNTSDSMVPFATLNAKMQYPILNDYGDWYQIDVSGRIGYVYKPATTRPFTSSDQFFQTTEDYVTIYNNSSGSLVPVGSLTKGQVYPRISDYGDWHQIKFGNDFGYVWEANTIPAGANSIKNLNPGLANINRSIIPKELLTVYDNTSGTLVPFATLNAKRPYPILSDYGDWYQIDVSGRIGYVYKPNTTMAFLPSDRFFQVTEDHVSIYDNSSGSLVQVGFLTKGQVYPRVSDYGDWHQIKFGNSIGYVWKGSTIPASGNSLRDLNLGLSNSARTFIPKEQLPVYDNTSGSLVPFASLNANKQYPILSDYGDWYQVDVSGRIGFVYKMSTTRPFLASDRYFSAKDDNIPVYDNSSGSLVPVGILMKGQQYPRVSDYGDWHQIKFGNKYAYVWKGSTETVDNTLLKNENTGSKNSARTFRVIQNVMVYDNTNGSLVPFAILDANTIYPIISDMGEWFQIDFSGRIGYVYKDTNFIQYLPTIIDNYKSYNYTLNQFLSKQMAVMPQTDLYKNYPAYVSKQYVSYLNDPTHSPGYYVTGDTLNVREFPNSDAGTYIYGTLKFDTKITVLEDINGWYRILYTWRNARSADTLANLDPTANSKFQHLRLDILADVPTEKLNDVLSGKGILSGKGQSFKAASLKYGVNEVYLVSHAILETGNGTSPLATGVPIKVNNGIVTIVDPLKETPQLYVYNMYGIGAKDACPLQCGAQTAYDKGWVTPEAAIVYGAEFVKSDYIGIGQNTIYKMRWNPDFIYQYNGVIYNRYPNLSSATHQYATDIGWVVKQAQSMESIYQQLEYYNAVFDIPVFQ